MTSSRIATLAIAAIAIALVVAQDVAPQTTLYHSWQYALALAIALVVMIAYANAVRRGQYGVGGKRTVLALAGAAIVAVAGLASGLLGPDTATVVGTPGTVTPLPALGAAAFFSAADADGIARGDAVVTLRRRNAPQIDIAASNKRVIGESVVYLDPRPAAFVDAWDVAGNHLTITQPTNTSFLSPIILFRQQQRIGQQLIPFDTFATPAQHRMFHALYFTPADLAGFAHRIADPMHPAVILSMADETGRPLGVTLAPSGNDLTIGSVRIRVTIGTYPALAIAAAPPTWALAIGIALFVAALVWSVMPPPKGDATDERLSTAAPR
jgi:hypothetical protein